MKGTCSQVRVIVDQAIVPRYKQYRELGKVFVGRPRDEVRRRGIHRHSQTKYVSH